MSTSKMCDYLICFFRAYWGFADHFKSQADSLFDSLEFSKQKQLQGEMSNSSSNNSLDRPVNRIAPGAKTKSR